VDSASQVHDTLSTPLHLSVEHLVRLTTGDLDPLSGEHRPEHLAPEDLDPLSGEHRPEHLAPEVGMIDDRRGDLLVVLVAELLGTPNHPGVDALELLAQELESDDLLLDVVSSDGVSTHSITVQILQEIHLLIERQIDLSTHLGHHLLALPDKL